MTNYEKIKQMDYPTLADFINSHTDSCDNCPAEKFCESDYNTCYHTI